MLGGEKLNYNEVFIDAHKLPNPLSKEESCKLLERIKQGDENAKAKFIEHNIRLVLYQVMGRFKNVQYDKNELVSIGIIGLINAVTTFDVSKNIRFSVYAIRCIDNEILQFLRKLKKEENIVSLSDVIYQGKDGDELKIEDTLSYDTDFIKEYTDNETNIWIRKIVNDLPERERQIIMLYFGFYDNKCYKQLEIANMLSVTGSYVSRLIKRIIGQIRMKIEENGIIELRIDKTSKGEIAPKEEGEKKMSRKVKTIYELFDSYSKEQVDTVLEMLSDEERELITLRYGEDLNNPITRKLSKKEHDKFYGILIQRMRRLLTNLNKKNESRKCSDIDLNTAKKHNDGSVPTVCVVPNLSCEKSDATGITKEDCEKMLGLLKVPDFNQMMSTLSVKEAVIISLKLGYIDGKYFSTDSIAQFLGIENQEVVDTTKKILLLYKDSFNQFIDSTIAIVTEDPKKLERIPKENLPSAKRGVKIGV